MFNAADSMFNAADSMFNAADSMSVIDIKYQGKQFMFTLFSVTITMYFS